MKFEKIKGLVVAPFTPFDKQGELDLSPIAAYGKLLQNNGLIGVFINGSSGEGYMRNRRRTDETGKENGYPPFRRDSR